MASIFSKILSLFGGGAPSGVGVREAEPREYQGCLIYATPIREGAQFRLAGRIEKEVGGEVRVRNFVRADLFTGEDDAMEFTFRKAEQIIDQNRALFTDGAATGNA